MRSTWIVTGVAITLFLSGCGTPQHNPYPIATHPETRYQLKMQAAAQWQALAQHQAKTISSEISPAAVIFVRETKNPSTFARAYNKMLKSALISSGFAVSNSEAGAQQVVTYDAQVIQHKDRDSLRNAIGAASATTMGYLIAKNMSNTDQLAAAVVSLSVAYDYLQWSDDEAPTPDTEILMTTEVDQGDKKIYSNTTIYYLNPGDIGLYKPGASEKTFKITASN